MWFCYVSFLFMCYPWTAQICANQIKKHKVSIEIASFFYRNLVFVFLYANKWCWKVHRDSLCDDAHDISRKVSHFIRFSLSPGTQLMSLSLHFLGMIRGYLRFLGNIYGIYWGYVGDIWVLYWGHQVSICGISWGYLGNIFGNLWCILGILWRSIGDIQGKSVGYHHGITWESRS